MIDKIVNWVSFSAKSRSSSALFYTIYVLAQISTPALLIAAKGCLLLVLLSLSPPPKQRPDLPAAMLQKYVGLVHYKTSEDPAIQTRQILRESPSLMGLFARQILAGVGAQAVPSMLERQPLLKLEKSVFSRYLETLEDKVVFPVKNAPV